MGALDDLFGQIEDQPMPGGCDLCDAFQVLEITSPGVWEMHVTHDDWCPFLRSRDAETN